jgi:hypothetical protein
MNELPQARQRRGDFMGPTVYGRGCRPRRLTTGENARIFILYTFDDFNELK